MFAQSPRFITGFVFFGQFCNYIESACAFEGIMEPALT